MSTSSNTGQEFEQDVLHQLERLLSVKLTARSGAHWDNADLSSSDVLIECKVKNSFSNFRVPVKELRKLKAQALKLFKKWIYIQKNTSGSYVLLDLNDFIELLTDK